MLEKGIIMMKKSSLVVALTLAVALVGAAYADDPTPDNNQSVASTKTRAEVQAELAQAKRDGSIKAWSMHYNHLAVAKSVNTRNEVLADLKAAQATGELKAFNSEVTGFADAARAVKPAAATRVLAGTSPDR